MNFEGHNSVHSSGGKNLYADTHTEMEARRRKKEKDGEGERGKESKY